MDEPRHPAFWDAMYRNGAYKEYWEEPGVSPRFMALLDSLSLPPDSAILDIGCGSGLEACSMAQRGFSVDGIDISQRAIELARQRATELAVNARFTVASALELPFADNSFGLLTDRGCLHLIPHARWQKYAQEAARVLQPGGLLLLRGCSDAGNPDFHALSDRQISADFQRAGFRQRSCSELQLYSRSGGLPALEILLQSGNPVS